MSQQTQNSYCHRTESLSRTIYGMNMSSHLSHVRLYAVDQVTFLKWPFDVSNVKMIKRAL